MAVPSFRRFRARAARDGSRVTIPVPFDPAEAWGRRERYHVTGTVEGSKFRGPLVFRDGAWLIERGKKSVGAALLRDGQEVAVEVWPEGPQLDQLAADILEVLSARPKARAAFEGLAQFYRNGWLRWIDATKRRPEVRAERITEMVRQLEAGQKERAQPPSIA